MKLNMVKGAIDLEKFSNENIAIQCDTYDLEKKMMLYLYSLGVTSINGSEIYDYTETFGEYILSYWSEFAENGYYLIKKSRTGRYFIDYAKNHQGTTVNINDFIEFSHIIVEHETKKGEKSEVNNDVQAFLTILTALCCFLLVVELL